MKRVEVLQLSEWQWYICGEIVKESGGKSPRRSKSACQTRRKSILEIYPTLVGRTFCAFEATTKASPTKSHTKCEQSPRLLPKKSH